MFKYTKIEVEGCDSKDERSLSFTFPEIQFDTLCTFLEDC